MTSIPLSRAEQAYIRDGIAVDVRTDGRACLQYRPASIELDALPLSHGSARVTLGAPGCCTQLLASVKLELSSPDADHPNEGRVCVSTDCWTSAAADRDDATALTQELNEALQTVFEQSSCIDKRALCVLPSKFCWVAAIDILILENAGNSLDASTLAAFAALASTRIPKLRLVPVEGGGDFDVALDDDPSATLAFPIAGVPLTLTVWHVGAHDVVDATLEEEACASGRTMVAINRSGAIAAVHTTGSLAVHPDRVVAALRRAAAFAGTAFAACDAVAGKTTERKPIAIDFNVTS